MEQGTFPAIDFSKAFESVSHTYVSAFFQCMSLTPYIIKMLLFFFSTPLQRILLARICLNSAFKPTWGFRQGCPPSAALFARMISPVINALHKGVPKAKLVLYADDMMIIRRWPPEQCYSDIHGCIRALREFKRCATLIVNVGKTILIPKGDWTLAQKQRLVDTNMKIKTATKCLRVMLRDATPQQVFAPAMQKAMLRVLSM